MTAGVTVASSMDMRLSGGGASALRIRTNLARPLARIAWGSVEIVADAAIALARRAVAERCAAVAGLGLGGERFRVDAAVFVDVCHGWTYRAALAQIAVTASALRRSRTLPSSPWLHHWQ